MKRGFLFILSILFSISNFAQVSNYGYTSTTSTWAANTSPTVITGLGSGINDALSSAITIPFSFTYDGVAYTQFKASSNGFITFNTANTLAQPTNNLKTSVDRTILAVLWDDDQTGASGNVNYLTTGTTPNRILTIEWLALRWNKSGFSAGTIDCQIKLYESTNVIEYIYNRGSYQSFGNSIGIGASIGLGGSTSGDFLSLSDLVASPTKSTVTETTTIGASPTNLTTLTAGQANTVIPNGTKYRFYPPIANDNCSGSTSLTVNSGSSCTSTSSGSTIGATQSLAACVGTADDDVWYSFVATQTVHSLTESPVTIGDAVMQVYSGSCASLSTIACVNNATTGNETTTLTNLAVGNTYFVRVHSFANGSGQGTFTMCATTPPTIITSGTLSSFSSCTGVVSSEQNYSVLGSGLSTDITITAPTGFEISKTSGGVFSSSLSLTQTSGSVSSTAIYVRVSASATGNPSGNITNSSTNATTQNIAVNDVVTLSSVGGTVASDQNVISGGNASTVNLSGNTGNVIKWQRDVSSTFGTAIDIANTTTSVSGSSMGAITQTIYYRAVVQNGTCPSVNSEYVTITVVSGLPIELLYFRGEFLESGNKLCWSTASEHNNDYFSIEKSVDGKVWKTIDTRTGAGNSTMQLFYTYTDQDIEKVVNYYVLKQTDYDGKFKYSDIISVDNTISRLPKRIANATDAIGQEINLQYYRGLVIIRYEDGTSEKIIK